MEPFALAHELAAAGQPFVLATVVRCQPPASARPGAKAIVLADGSLRGWVGGSCAEPLVIREAQRALESGTPRLMRLSPTVAEGGSQHPDRVEYLMTCHSGGTLEIFIEPVIPAPRLCLVGETPVASTLAALGSVLGYRVERVEATAGDAFGGEGDQTFVVVATMGSADEEALEAALRSPAPYVALVASPKRAAVLRDYLAGRGVTPEQLQKLKAPAGLDLGGQAPEEIALSIMAEIVQTRATLPASPRASLAPPPPDVREATDPVCGMSVSIADARFVTEHAGTAYYFCCGGCKTRFEAEPMLFVGASA